MPTPDAPAPISARRETARSGGKFSFSVPLITPPFVQGGLVKAITLLLLLFPSIKVIN
jgi:hypothetical protein